MADNRTPLVLAGMACRFPGSPDLQAYWHLLQTGQCAVGAPPPGRWPEAELQAAGVSLQGGYVSEMLAFDPAFFQISLQEAQSMDPQQRLLLLLAWECLEDAGLPPAILRGSRVGVFIGLSSADYAQRALYSPQQVNMYTITGQAASVCANRISYTFDFKGPSLVTDTACSSGLVALHLARQSLLAGECELALVGAAHFLLAPLIQQGFAEARALSPDGLCRPFDAAANGMVRGEGGGMVLLGAAGDQRLRRPYARLLGSAVAQDGQTNGLSAPSPAGQRATLQRAWQAAELDPLSLGYVECHGTGTPLGDPVEAKALGDLLSGSLADRPAPCLIGSVKSNLGHLEAAAGLAGLIKTALSLYHRWIPASLHIQTPNPRIPFARRGLTPAQKAAPWPDWAQTAGVSAFGFGGTNAHVVLGLPDDIPASASETATEQTSPAAPLLFVLSAARPEALPAQARLLADWLEALPDSPGLLPRLSQQLLQGRQHLLARQAVLATERGALLQHWRQLQPPPQRARLPRLAFVFAGMGAQGQHTIAQLLALPAARQRLKALAPHFSAFFSRPLLTLLQEPTAAEAEDPAVLQASIFALQQALLAQWAAWGLKPAAVMGSSMGEISAALAAGWLDDASAVALLMRRIALLKTRIGSGSMLVLGLPAAEIVADLARWQEAQVWIATVNGPALCGVAGETAALARCRARWEAAGCWLREIPGAQAPSHTPLMEGLAPDLLAAAAGVLPAEALQPDAKAPAFWSTVSAERQRSAPDAAYWWQNVRQPVQLWPTLQALAATDGPWIFVELSPHAVLAPALQGAELAPAQPLHFYPSLHAAQPDCLWQTLARLFAQGLNPDWRQVAADMGLPPWSELRPLDLPPYAWQLQTCLLPAAPADALHPSFAAPPPVAQKTDPPAETLAEPAARAWPADGAQPSPAQQHALLEAALLQELAAALQQDPASLDPLQPLKNLGIGSLMGMELYNRIRQHWQVQLPLSAVLKGPSLRELATLLQDALQAQQAASAAAPAETAPVVAQTRYPLAPAQARFWFAEQLLPEAVAQWAWHIPVLLQLRGPLDPDRLQRAFDALLQRHVLLRTVYGSDPETGQPWQQLLPAAALDWAFARVADVGPDWLLQRARRPFDLQQAPPFRVALLQHAAERHSLLIDMHHILADGYSFRLLFDDLQQAYAGQALAPRQPDFYDYAREQQAAEAPAALQAWWLEQLAEVPSRLQLPTDFSRPPRQSFVGALQLFALEPALVEALHQRSREQGVSVFCLLQAAFEVLLQRLSGQSDFVVGTPVLGRDSLAWQQVVGPFLNLLPLRSSLNASPDLRLGAFWQAVQQRLLDAFDHALSFEHLIEALNPPRDPAWAPLVQVVHALHAPVDAQRLGEAEVQQQDLDLGVARFDLALTLHPEADGSFSGRLEYRRDLFAESSMAALVAGWRYLLARMLAAPDDAPLATLALAPWRPQLATPPMQPDPALYPLPLRIWQQVQQRPQALAVAPTAQADGLSYAQLWQRAGQLARQLKAYWPPEQPAVLCVAVDLPAGPELLIAWLGIWLAGAAYLPLEHGLPPLRQADLLALAQPVLLLTGQPEAVAPEGLPCLPWPELNAASLAEATDPAPEALLSPPALAPDALAYTLFTSGSSGRPKAVQVGHGSLARLAAWHLQTYPLAPAEAVVQLASPAFDAAAWEIWPALAAGATLCFPSETARRDPELLLPWLQHVAAVQLFLPTPLLQHALPPVCRQPWPRSLRYLLVGGDRLPPLAPEALAALPCPLYNHYGPSENTVVTTACSIGPEQALHPPIGMPLPGQQLFVLDSLGQPLPPGWPGELAIGGSGLALGYLHLEQATAAASQVFFSLPPEADAAAFAEPLRLYRSGDRVRLQQGQLYFLGRLDRQFKRRGVRLEPAEIEARLQDHPAVQQVLVLPASRLSPDGAGGLVPETLLAWVQTPPDTDPRALKAWLQERLPALWQPDHLICLPALPLTRRGKPDLAALALRLPQDLAADVSDAPPPKAEAADTPLLQQVQAIWQRLLPIQAPPAPQASFFELGGHSLLALELRQALQSELGLALPLAVLFERPVLADLVDWLAAQPRLDQTAQALSDLRLSEAGEPYAPFPLTEVQQAYWVGRQLNEALELSGVSAHAYLELDLPDLDLVRLEQAIQRLIAHHPMLRMIVRPDGQQQVLAEVPPWRLPVHPGAVLSPADCQTLLAEIRQRLSHAVHPAGRWPLFALEATCLPAGVSQTFLDRAVVRLHLSLDALMADASSLMLLARQLEALYDQPERVLPRSPFSFRDWVLAQQALRRDPQHSLHARYQRDRDWWLAQLATLPPAPGLPRAAGQGAEARPPRYQRLSGQLPPPDWQRLQALAGRWQVTPTALLLSLFASVLGRWNEQAPLTLNLTTFQRPPRHLEVSSDSEAPELAGLVGDFTQLSLLPVWLQPDLYAQTRALQQQLWQVLEHGLFTGIECLRHLRQQHGPDATQWQMPVVFTSVLGQGALRLPFGAERVWSCTQTPQVWLDHQVAERDGALIYDWDYPAEHFPPALMPAVFDCWEQALQRLSLIASREPDSSSVFWPELFAPVASAVPLPVPPTSFDALTPALLHSAYVQQALQQPERLALVDGERQLSYGQLLSESWHCAGRLRQLWPAAPSAEERVVAICLRPGWQQAVAVLGTLLAGAAYLPLDPAWPLARRQALLHQTRARALIGTVPEDGLPCPQLRLDPLPADSPLPAATVLQAALAACDPAQLAYIIFTSGSTGLPKGVMLSHAAAWQTVAEINRRLALNPEDRVFALSALNFDLSVYDLFGPLAQGAALVYPEVSPQPFAQAGSGADSLPERRDPARWLQTCRAQGVTIWNSVPALMAMFCQSLQGQPPAVLSEALPALRAVLLSGDWIPLDLPEQLRQLWPAARLISLGGATEAAIWSVWYTLSEPLPGWPSVPYGQALAGQAIYVLDAALQPCPLWASGELYLAGHGLARGYFQAPELSAERFITHPSGERLYRTGDFGRWRPGPDGQPLVEFLGRRDQQVKVRGYRIELAEIEATLLQHPEVTQAVVLAPHQNPTDPLSPRYLVAWWSGAAAPERLLPWLRARLPEYMLPVAAYVLPALPLNATGKVDRTALLQQLPQRPLTAPAPAPQSQVFLPWLEALRALLLQTLDLAPEALQPDTDLLALGVNSLDVIRLGQALEARFGLTPSMGDLFRLRSLNALAGFYAEAQGAAPPAPLQSGLQAVSSPAVPSPAELLLLPSPGGFSASDRPLGVSTRDFVPEAPSLSALASLLSVLRAYPRPGARPDHPAAAGPAEYQWAYASAGSLYPVTLYLQLREPLAEASTAAADALVPGLYRYQPLQHALLPLSPYSGWSLAHHFAPNQPIAATAGFALYLVADLDRIQPVYLADARDYALLEAGSMAQLLRQQAPTAGLGLCAVGQVDRGALASLFGWQAQQALLLSFLGGPLPAVPSPDAVQDAAPEDNDWEEWIV